MLIFDFIKNCRLIRKPALFLYHIIHNRHLVKFWYSTHLSPHCVFEGLNMVHPHSSFYGKMGLGSYMGSHSHLNADIGRFTSIAPGVKCINGTHPMKEPFVTTSPLFFSLDTSKNPQKETFATEQLVNEFRQIEPNRGIDISIGSDCWIGADVTLLGGVSVGDGAVVLANALVIKDVPPYAIVGGIPAKVIDYRYDEETINFLLRTSWWNKDIVWLRENWRLMTDINTFKKYFENQ